LRVCIVDELILCLQQHSEGDPTENYSFLINTTKYLPPFGSPVLFAFTCG